MENKRVELLVERSTKHGQAGRETRSRTYLIWQSMIGRCHRPSDSSYRWYGAKGVTVCDRWRKFEDFFADMGTAPDGMHIHRTSGSSVYSKETCVWMNESEHIGLHNMEQGWGARMTRAQLIDALTGAKQQLAAEREKVEFQNKVIKQHKEALHRQQEQLDAERHKVEILTRENDGRDQREAEYAQKMVAEIQARDKQLADEREKRSYSRLHVDLAESRRDNDQLRELLDAVNPRIIPAG